MSVNDDGCRDYTQPSYWKVPVKPADNKALETLSELVRSENPGRRISNADVVRGAVYEALSAREGCEQ